jgi:O-antigen ligase
MQAKRLVAKIASYILLALGSILTLACLVAATAVFVAFPDANIVKVILTGIGLLVGAAIVGIVTFALFNLIKNSAQDIGEHRSYQDTWQRKNG